MKMMKNLQILALFLVIPSFSMAWGVLGHRVTGGIAEHYLSPKAKTTIKKILGNQSVALSGGWADFIKSDRSYDYIGPWHYINVPAGLSEKEFNDHLKKDTSANVYTRVRWLTGQLKNKQLAHDKQVFYLRLLIHLVADIHQPLHAGRPEDKGGNSIKLYWFNTPTNLHRVWDEHLVEFQQLSYTEHVAAINFTTPAQNTKWQKQPLSAWIYESYLAAGNLYAGVKPEDRLSYHYNYLHVDLMNLQLLKGGVRLAGLLNEIFGN
jgi:hypothetical protein